MSVRLFVGNLPYEVTESDLKELFAPAGPLSSVIIPIDRETGKRRGFAFIEFVDQASADEATRKFNNQLFKGRAITISEARERQNRPEGSAGGRSGIPARSYSPRPSFNRPSPLGRPDLDPTFVEGKAEGRGERRNRNSLANAKPMRGTRKFHRMSSRDEIGTKKSPIRVRAGGRFFGSSEDDVYDDNPEPDNPVDLQDENEDIQS
jgi:RNA recognition motif-containing protein